MLPCFTVHAYGTAIRGEMDSDRFKGAGRLIDVKPHRRGLVDNCPPNKGFTLTVAVDKKNDQVTVNPPFILFFFGLRVVIISFAEMINHMISH